MTFGNELEKVVNSSVFYVSAGLLLWHKIISVILLIEKIFKEIMDENKL
jgi:hypothetical protein